MIFDFIHPGAVILATALICFFSPPGLKKIFMLAGPVAALASLWTVRPGTFLETAFMNVHTLRIMDSDKLSWSFGLIFCIIILLANIYSLRISKKGETAAGLIYAGASLGVVFAGDWLTMIFCWELMAVGSVFLVWFGGTRKSRKAGFRYILVHTFSGSLFLAGIFLKYSAGDTLVHHLAGNMDFSSWLIFFGVAVNAAIPPLHPWLPDAYPEATLGGSVFLNSFTTKVSVYALIRLFAGFGLLAWAGAFMALYGVVYAVIENDMRRLLSYHIISQVGFIVAGVGIGGELAINGAIALTYGNILYKSLLFMATGAVIYSTGFRKITDLGGLRHQLPLTALFFNIGAMAISGVPLLNGFTSKPLVISAAGLAGYPAVELLLYMGSIGTFLSVGLKLNYFVFFGEKKDMECAPVPMSMKTAMGATSVLCFVYGLFPGTLYRYLPYEINFQAYTLDHVISTLELLLGAFVVFSLLLPKLKTHDTVSIDTDWFYRVPFAFAVDMLTAFFTFIFDEFEKFTEKMVEYIMPLARNPWLWYPENNSGIREKKEYYNENYYRRPVGLLVVLIIFTVFFSIRQIAG